MKFGITWRKVLQVLEPLVEPIGTKAVGDLCGVDHPGKVLPVLKRCEAYGTIRCYREGARGWKWEISAYGRRKLEEPVEEASQKLRASNVESVQESRPLLRKGEAKQVQPKKKPGISKSLQNWKMGKERMDLWLPAEVFEALDLLAGQYERSRSKIIEALIMGAAKGRFALED